MSDYQPGQPASAPYEAVEHELGLLLRRGQVLSREVARQVHPELDLTSYGTLVRLAESGPTRAQQLATYFGVDKSAMSRQVRSLERLGLLERRPDPADARAQVLTITEPGWARLREVRAARRERFLQLLHAWPATDVAAVARALRLLNSLGT